MSGQNRRRIARACVIFGGRCDASHQVHGSRTCGERARAARSGRSRGAWDNSSVDRAGVDLCGAASLRGRVSTIAGGLVLGVSGASAGLALDRCRCWVARAPPSALQRHAPDGRSGLPDSRKVDLRFGDAARQVQNGGAAVRARDLMRQRLDRGAVHRVHHDRQGEAMATRVVRDAGLASLRFRPGAALGVNPVGGGLTKTLYAPPSQCAGSAGAEGWCSTALKSASSNCSTS